MLGAPAARRKPNLTLAYPRRARYAEAEPGRRNMQLRQGTVARLMR